MGVVPDQRLTAIAPKTAGVLSLTLLPDNMHAITNKVHIAFVDSTSSTGDEFTGGSREDSLGAHATSGIVTPDYDEPPEPQSEAPRR